MKILAVDYGDSRTGLATCDRTEFLTSPITPQITVKARDKVAARVCEVAKEIEAELIVIGLPLNMDGSSGPAAQSARAFARNLLSKRDAPLLLWDERLSTAAVTRTLLEGDASRRRRGEVVDKMAAAYMLQGAIDAMQERQSESPSS